MVSFIVEANFENIQGSSSGKKWFLSGNVLRDRLRWSFILAQVIESRLTVSGALVRMAAIVFHNN